MKSILNVAKFIIGWPLAIVALFFVIRLFINQKGIIQNLTTLNPLFLFFSVTLFVLFFFTRAFFWQKLLIKKKISFSFKTTAYTWGLAEFKRFVPGTIWPILGRSSAYQKLGAKKEEILKGILHEAQFLIISCLAISVVSFSFLLTQLFHVPSALLFTNLSIFGAAAIIALFLFHKSIAPKFRFFEHSLPNLSFKENLDLLLLSSGAFTLFGLANYFAVSSLRVLSPQHILPLTGFFVFSFLAGYLSFLAPMGLGVREALLTAGLSRFIPVSLAALGAVLARIVQIVSELIFLLLCIAWEKSKSKLVTQVEIFLLKHKYEVFLAIAVILYISYFTIASFLRYNNFFTGRFDLGNMDQTVWNTVHGRIFQTTDANGTAIVSRLAFHADFMLVLLAPFYLIWQDPRVLLLIQSVGLGVGGILLYLIAQKVFKNKAAALAIAISYFIYPAINYANLYDFHAVTLAVPLFLTAWYFLLQKRYAVATFFLFLAGTTKEQVWIIVGLFGIYMLFWKRKYFLGLLTGIAGFSLFYFLIWHIIPSFNGGAHFALSYFSDFGSTPGGIITHILLSPGKLLSDVLGKRQQIYLLELFGPVAFLPLVSPFTLVFALPDLAISLLSQDANLHTIYYHYGAIPAIFIFLSTIYGVQFLQNRFGQMVITFIPYVILVPALVCAYLFGPLPGAKIMNSAMFTDQLSYAPLIDSFLYSIPKPYSVAATNNIGSHLSHRQEIYTIPVGLKKADIVVFLLNDHYAQPSLPAQKKMSKELDQDPQYTKLISYQDFVVYKKKSVPTYSRRYSHNILPIFKGN